MTTKSMNDTTMNVNISGNGNGGIVLLLKNPDEYIPKHLDSLHIIFNLSKIINFNISVISISHQAWDYFNSSVSNLLPIKLFFPPYSKNDIMVKISVS